MSKAVKSVSLFFQEGSSDKVYNAQIVKDGDGYTVSCQWGRRGASLQEGSKAVRVPLAKAEAKFASLVREKTNKGYQELTSDVQPAAVAPPEGEGSGSKVTGKRARVGVKAQLAEAIDDEGSLGKFLSNDSIVAQQKIDGERVLVHVNENELLVTNREGQKKSLDAARFDGLSYLPHGTIVDGELLGGDYWLFDVLAFAGDDVKGRGYLERFELLNNEIEPALSGDIRVLPVAVGAKAKQKLHDKLRAANAEGLIFKDREAPYTPGARGAAMRKFKFLKSADVVILENAGNAYLMAVYDGKKLFEIGKVFAGTTNATRKALDAALARGERPVCEVKYLYATDDHQLFQPVFVNARDDKAAKECLRAQLVQTSRKVIVVA
jgi:bifunctional non-homologous end joining protein LigD